MEIAEKARKEKEKIINGANNGNTEAIKSYILEVFGNGADGQIALRIAKCESNYNPNAVGDLHLDGGTNPSYGVFQIRYFGGSRGSKEQLLNAKYNIEQAKRMRDRQGWGIWSCYK